MDLPAFEAVVGEVIASLPPHIREAIKEVAIVIEENPPPARAAKTRGILLGLYEGVPVTAWGRDFSGKLPDKITLFQHSIELVAGSPERVPEVIRTTLLHEIAHHFGFDHPHIRKMEERWRREVEEEQ